MAGDSNVRGGAEPEALVRGGRRAGASTVAVVRRLDPLPGDCDSSRGPGEAGRGQDGGTGAVLVDNRAVEVVVDG